MTASTWRCSQRRMGMLALLHTLVAFALGATDRNYIEDADRFPGWRGELPSDGKAEPVGNVLGYGEAAKETWRGEVQQLAWTPRAFLFKKFMTDEECQHLIDLSRPSLTKSTVVDSETGASVDSQVRTSTGTFFARAQDEIIDRIEKRIAQVSHIPQQNGEGLQILRYVNGQKYEPHHDYFHDQVNARPENGGQRIATVLMYLTTVEEGGETVFPSAHPKVEGPGWSDCAREGMAVHPVRGDALLFFSLHPNGEVDPTSMHGSCPTTKGEKWSATKWMHVAGFGMSDKYQRAKWGECIDADERCKDWAESGECKRNSAYMLTSCRLSCGVCTPKNKSA